METSSTVVVVAAALSSLGLLAALFVSLRTAKHLDGALASLQAEQNAKFARYEARLEEILTRVSQDAPSPAVLSVRAPPPVSASKTEASEWSKEQVKAWIETVVGHGAYESFFSSTTGQELVELVEDSEHGFSFGDKCFFMGVSREDCTLLDRASRELMML